MTKKDRIIAAINFKDVDRIPTSYRALKPTSEILMRYFNFKNPKDFIKNYQEFLDILGSDFWSSGSKLDSFNTYIPKCLSELPKPPYVDDGLLLYSLGIHAKKARIEKYNYDYPMEGIDPPLANIESINDINKDFLSSKIDLFDFSSYQNKTTGHEASEKNNFKNSNNEIICIGSPYVPQVKNTFLRHFLFFKNRCNYPWKQ